MTLKGYSRWLGAVIAALVILASFVVGASAHIGASHSPFSTVRPDLTSVEVDGNLVDFCFDEEVLGADTAGDFALLGYDSATQSQGDSVDLDSEKDNCVEVNFSGGRDDKQFTIGVVEAGAVRNRGGTENIQASASLTGSTATGGGGRTAAPNLVDFDVNDGADEITYTFDQDLVCPPAPPPGFFGSFGFYRQAGQGGAGGRENGDAIADCDDDEVTVAFNAPGVDNVERVFVDAGGVGPCALASDSGPGECTEYEGQGSGETDSPDLIDAERTGDDQVTFILDQEATVNSDDNFFVYAEDGTDFFGASKSCQEDNEEIECDFAGIEDAADAELVLAGVNDGAAEDLANPKLQNTVGSVPLGGGLVAVGVSDGPDLETCSTDQPNGRATFVFDEPVDENSAAQQNFALFDAEGDLPDGTDIQDAVANSVVVEFDSDAVDAAVGCHVDLGAVDDFLTNESPAASVGLPGTGPSPSPTDQPPQCQTNPGAICGSSGNDSLQGTPGDDVFYGGAGDDVIDGGEGNDKIFGGDGNDTLSGGEGQDEINGGGGGDVIIGGSGADSLTGAQGNDKITGDDRPAGKAAARRGVSAAQESDGPDSIDGGGGDDSIRGGGDDDDVVGGDGADVVAGQDGADKVHSGGDEDRVSGGDGGDKMWGDKGDDKLKGEEGNDTLYGGKGVNDFNGGSGKDHCILDNKKDETKSCEKKTLNFTLNFMPFLMGYLE